MEISVILDNKVVYKKEIMNFVKKLKNKTPDKNAMIKMENKFTNLIHEDKSARYIYSLVAGTIITTCNSTMCYAADLSQISSKIRETTRPIIELFASLGYPTTYCMLIVGAIMVITGKKSKGLEVIKWACIGYIGLEFVPFLLGLLEQIGSELRNSL
ncbi:hypothetical protein FDB28_10105 [Clostridium botulinum]|nr:hypothetical protein [Clostridium botulinum]NFS96559.1 hypothetical protein [Clostridium botulinum]